MEEWETIISDCQEINDLKNFSKVFSKAELLLAKDLAPFEIEWFLSTLLQKPVNLVNIVTEKYANSDWDKCVRRVLELLATVVSKYDEAQIYYGQIVQLCHLNFEPLLRQAALLCLTKVACKSVEGAHNFSRHVSSLEESTTCKTQLAVLVGTICEHHPSVVDNEITKIWRVYLNMLDSNKYTVTVTKAVLEGISSLFKHFGMELPTMELNVFYDKLVTYLTIQRCEEVCLKLIKNYAHLFRERISRDRHVRTRVWQCDVVCARPAILALYRMVCDTITDISCIQEILDKEIHPRTKSPRFYERFTALRVLTDIHTRKGLGDLDEHVDLQVLEFDLRNGNVNYETCETMSWCIQSNLPFSGRLLQAAILFYESFPASKRTEVVIHSLLRADPEIRTMVTNFLITESIHSTSKEQCLKIWRDIFNTRGNTDNIVIENCVHVVRDLVEYVTRVMEAFMGGEEMVLPETIPPLLSLLVLVLRLNPTPDFSCPFLARLLLKCAKTHKQVAPAAILCGLYSGEIYENLSIAMSAEEDMQLECALALVEMSDEMKRPASEMIAALEIVFTKSDLQSSVLSTAVRGLEKVLQENSDLNGNNIASVVQKVIKLSQRIDNKSKDDRILRWDIVKFLGKYGNQHECNDDVIYADNILITKLRNTLKLEIPDDGGTFKIDLQGVLHSAIAQGDTDALRTLLTIICAHLSTNRDPLVEAALVRVLVLLSRSPAPERDKGLVVAAVTLCDGGSANQLIRYIAQEKSSKTRRMLLEAVETLLQSTDGEILENILEYVVPNETDLINQANVEIFEFLIQQLKENNSLCLQYLPKIITTALNSGTETTHVLEMAADVFVDKTELYDDVTVKDTVEGVFRALNSSKTKKYSKINVAVEFVRKIWAIKDFGFTYTLEEILEYFLEITGKIANFRVVMSISRIFGVDEGRVEKVFLNSGLIDSIPFKGYLGDADDFDMEVILDLYNEYFDTLWKMDHGKSLMELISNLTPKDVINYERKLSKCLNNAKIKTNLFKLITQWLKALPIKDISTCIEKYSFEKDHEIMVHAMNIMLNVSRYGNDGFSMEFDGVTRWAAWISMLNASGFIERNLKSKMAYLNDLVDVSLVFSFNHQILTLLKEDDPDKRGVRFFQSFMPAIFRHLLRIPPLVLERNLEGYYSILNDFVKYAARKNRGEDVLELVNLLWPKYVQETTFERKHSLLLDLSPTLPKLDPDSAVAQWVMETITAEGTKFEHKIKLFGIMAAIDKHSKAHSALVAHLPSRLSELRGLTSCCFRAILDALGTKHEDLLDIVISLAAGDISKGWWEHAIELCMAALAGADVRVYGAVYARCFEGRGLGVCTRLMVPLLRFSTSTFCEEFFSTVLEGLLSMLNKKPREVSLHYTYEKCVLDYVRALRVLQIVFQKVPKDHIESPRSVLYSRLAVGDSPLYAVKMACKLCVTLRSAVPCPDGADDSLRESCRLFQCANYNCLAAAICCTQLKPAICATVFNPKIWDSLIGDEEIHLPLRQQWNQRSTRQSVSIEVSGELLAERTAGSALSVRTPAFLRTLSEDPLQYDLSEEQHQVETQDLHLTDNPLNQHECAATLTALLSRISGLESVQWRDALIAALEGHARGNVKWLLAQAVCNSKEDLRPHAMALRPALLAVIATTARDGRLNSLHIDIMDTIIYWSEGSTQSAHLNTAVEYIIKTAIDYRKNRNVYYMLLDKLTKLVDETANVRWECFEGYLADPKSEAGKCCLDILKRVTKCKVHIPELVPALSAAIERKGAMYELSGLFAAVVSVALERGEGGELLKRYRVVMDRLRKTDRDEYIKVLCIAQKGYLGCCDESDFSSITDLTPKIFGRPKFKCLDILATYAQSARPHRRVTAMLETVGLADMLAISEALLLARNGLHLMEENFRQQIVAQVVDTSQHLPVKERKVAYDVLVKAFELLLSEPSEPAAKKRVRESNSLLLTTDDPYWDVVCLGLSRGLLEKNQELAKAVREGVGKCFSEDWGVRFCESFLLTVVVPLKNRDKVQGTDNLSALLEVFFHRTRNQEVFKKTRILSEPLETRQISTASSTRTLSRGHQFHDKQESALVGVDVQMTVEDILTSLMSFMEKNLQAATAVVVQLIKTLNRKRPGFDFDATMSSHIMGCLGIVCSLTPSLLEIAREVHIWDSFGLEHIINNLVKRTKNTEGEAACKLLLEDFTLRRSGPELFIMGTRVGHYVIMDERSPNFSLEDLTTCFGKLSNWDVLTSQERRSVGASLPLLWTDRDSFRACIEDCDYEDGPTWFNAMISSYRRSNRNTFKWITELDRWPRKQFDLSALMETTSWDRIRDSLDLELTPLPTRIKPSDCLVEWAARIMLRSAFLHSVNADASESHEKLSRSHQLLWCVSANERGLYANALDCCKSVTGLYESETLKWLRQKVLALRGIALERDHREGLKRALDLTESYTEQFVASSEVCDVLAMTELKLRLRRDLKCVEKEHIDCVKKELKDNFNEVKIFPKASKETVESIYVMVMSYYNELWENCTEARQSDLLYEMSKVLDMFVYLELGGKGGLMADVVLNRLDEFGGRVLPRPAALALMAALEPISPQLDQISLGILNENLDKLSECHERQRAVRSDQQAMTRYRQCLALVGDPQYLLLRYCESLGHALDKEDNAEWSRVFANTMAAVFDNPYAGPDYRVLFKYKRRIEELNGDGVTKQSRLRELSAIQSDLKVTRKDSLLLSHLCPALTRLERDDSLSKLLCLKRGVYVEKFEEKVGVFVDSIRRPSLVRCRLTDGSTARYIVKCGESARPHAVALRFLTAMQAVLPRHVHTGYHVTPLSEDCSLIEFLEDHERLRALVSSTGAGDVSTAHRSKDLILAPKRSLEQYEQLCAKVPAYLLRSAIETKCVSLQDFIGKKKKFTESLCDMTVLSYLYGLGDRHLENMMYRLVDGAVCHVDCGALLQHGAAELPPARLTRNVLAGCDMTVLENRLQRALSALRQSVDLLTPTIDVAFKWTGCRKDESHHIQCLLRGTTLSHLVTVDVLSKSKIKYKEKFIELLEDVFADFDTKDTYSIEEQVSSLLRQSTEPRILSVTRSGWEPWL